MNRQNYNHLRSRLSPEYQEILSAVRWAELHLHNGLPGDYWRETEKLVEQIYSLISEAYRESGSAIPARIRQIFDRMQRPG